MPVFGTVNSYFLNNTCLYLELPDSKQRRVLFRNYEYNSYSVFLHFTFYGTMSTYFYFI